MLDFSQGSVRLLERSLLIFMDKYKMAQDHSINIKLSNSQLDKLKLVTKNKTQITLRLW